MTLDILPYGRGAKVCVWVGAKVSWQRLNLGSALHFIVWALYSWGHVTIVFLQMSYIMGYNVKNGKKKEHIKNSKMPKFEVPSIND